LSDSLHNKVINRLAALEKEGLRRTLRPPVAGSIDLSSNDYLCLANDERLRQAMIAEIERGGCGATASRLLRGDRGIFHRAENRFAQFKNTERALYFSSGYAANIGVLTTFIEAGDTVFSDELNHASIIDGLRLTKARRVLFPHNDAAALEQLVRETPCEGERFLVVESLFSMNGDFAPLAEYARLCRRYEINLIVDEAHAVGVFGANGNGLIAEREIEADVFLSINTAGKALGAAGAFVCGVGLAIEYLIQRSRPFIFSTAAPPAVCAALLAAIEIVEQESERRQRLLELANFMRRSLRAQGFSVRLDNSPIIPVIIGDSRRALRVAEALQTDGFDVRAIRPPTVPPNTARLRVSLNAGLNEEILQRFAARLSEVF
jgi:8-amino-7-oxononanoate synthase